MAHLTGGAFTSLKEALAYDCNLQDIKSDEQLNHKERFESGISVEVIEGLENCYGSLHSLYQFLQLQKNSHSNLVSWLLYRDKKLSSVLLFQLEASHLRVITEMMAMSESDLKQFTHAVFDRYKNIKSITFNASELPHILPYRPHQKFICSENYIIDLPPSSEQFFLSLGRATRKTIKSANSKFRRDFPDFLLRICEARDFSPATQYALYNKLQLYKQASMRSRDKNMVIDEIENRRLLALIAERGVFVLVMINGEMRAGSIACKVGSNMVMLMSAADPLLTSYRLGFLVCYWAVCDAIERGHQQCHLLWGRYHYKTQLGALPHNLTRAVFYRSYIAMISSPLLVLSMFKRQLAMQCRNWFIYTLARSSNKWLQYLSRLLFFMRSSWRMLKR